MTAMNARLLIVCGTIVALITIALAAIVGTELAGRPVSSVVLVCSASIAPTIAGLLAFATSAKLRDEVKNGVGTSIAQQAATMVSADVAARASGSPSERSDDPPATIPPSDPTTGVQR